VRTFSYFLRTLTENTNGSVAPLFGLLLLAMVVAMGVSVDMARGTRVSMEAGGALDAAALAAAKSLRLENAADAELLSLANQYFDANFDAVPLADRRITATVDRVNHGVTLTAELTIPSTLAGLVGKDTIDIKSRSEAIYDVRNIELSMMLDVSGSMIGSKIADLKEASSELVDILLNANENGSAHKIGIAPFSTSVNAGVYAQRIGTRFDRRGRAYPGAYSTCLTDRSGTAAFSDANPMTGQFIMRTSSCPASAVLPLTSNRDDILGHIERLQAGGNTAGHLGTAWAWYLLSPNWATLWPADSAPVPYGTKDYQKVAILMTDGMYNSYYEGANGDSVTQARALCTNMKSAGVTVYTVGFQVPPEVLPVLQHCASSTKHFFDASNGAELKQTFRTIAERLSGLRLAS
jgi:Flp pilus assembly protein TadG